MHHSLSGYYAIAGFPALTVPAGCRKAGKPFGLTFVGEPFTRGCTSCEDGRLIAAAYAFEQAAAQHGRVAPPL
jgi:amidase